MGSQEQRLADVGTDFGGKLSLVSYALSSQPLEAGWGAATADLRWAIEEQLASRYQMVFRLLDEQGRAWAVEDREPSGGLRPFHEQPVGAQILDRQAVLVPAGTPPGSYSLKLGVYRLDTGEWLEVRDEAGSSRGVEMVLGQVQVRVPDTPLPEEALAVQHKRIVDFACGVRFLGFGVESGSFRPGDALELSLFWKAMEEVREDCIVSLRLEDKAGQTVTEVEGPLATSWYPSSQWARGQLTRGIHRLMIPAGVPSERYNLVISLHKAADGRAVPIRRWLVNWGYDHVLGTVQVESRVHQTDPPLSITYPSPARLGEGIELLGYDLDKLEVEAGGSLRLTLYWHALRGGEASYSVFNHLIDEGEHIWGQKDGVPGNGALPTSGWVDGEYVTDEYVIPVREDTPPGEYVIETGMYDPQTMRRLPVFDEQGDPVGDRILLTETPIRVR
ncbi:MAG TPA: hypothetical protein ENO24_04580 [Chloroflexi bacterium]|nr:hypothetical protein [Chloroflexota bacterium]